MQCGMSWPTLKIKPGNSQWKSKSPAVKSWDTDITLALVASLGGLMPGLLGSYSF